MKRTLHYCDSLPKSTANTRSFIHFCSHTSGWMLNAQTIEHLRGWEMAGVCFFSRCSLLGVLTGLSWLHLWIPSTTRVHLRFSHEPLWWTITSRSSQSRDCSSVGYLWGGLSLHIHRDLVWLPATATLGSHFATHSCRATQGCRALLLAVLGNSGL